MKAKPQFSEQAYITLWQMLSREFNNAPTFFDCEKILAVTVECGFDELANDFKREMQDLARDRNFPLS